MKNFGKVNRNMKNQPHTIDPLKTLGAHWTARKDYKEAQKVLANYLGQGELLGLFQSDDVC